MCPFPLVHRGGTAESDAGRSVARFTDPSPTVERALWSLVLAVSVLDIATTSHGLSIGLVEQNPFVRAALETHGITALVFIKATAVAVALLCRRLVPACALFVPLALAVTWLLAVGINLAAITSV